MLHITRKRFENFVIQTPDGENITIAVKQIGQRNVHLTCDSPKEYKIIRGEVYTRLKAALPPAPPKPPKPEQIEMNYGQ